MKSMTGFGRAIADNDGNSASVEIVAVNGRKQTDIRLTMPRELSLLEPEMKSIIREKVKRGSLSVTVTYQLRSELRADAVALDTELAASVVDKLRSLAQITGIESRIQVRDLLLIPGILQEAGMSPVDVVRPALMQALEQALEALCSMQKQEGGRLREDLQTRSKHLRDMVEAIAARVDDALVQHRDRLRERIAHLGVDLPLDDERLAREVAFCAEKSDITEEIVRLRSHLDQCAILLEKDADIGRELEFLCQEMNREINTAGSKTAHTTIAEIAISMKAEIARMREQVMNVE